MGGLYFDKNNMEKSLSFYQRAIQVNPFNPFVHTRLMKIYQKLNLKKEKELQTKLFGYINH
jgi:lipopolysaccharide biosynthesis regulator YciM